MEIVLAIAISAAVSAVIANAVGYYNFKIIDGYVERMIDTAKREIKKAYDSQSKR